MSADFGTVLRFTVFGESHGAAIGGILSGVPAGTEVDEEKIAFHMARRAPGRRGTTPRKEADKVQFLSGVLNGRAEGSPIAFIIENTNTRSSDYEQHSFLARPSHSDFPAFIKYKGFHDVRGGGHFSGRLTAPLVTAGSIVRTMLEKQGVYIGAHLLKVGQAEDEPFANPQQEELERLWSMPIPVRSIMPERVEQQIKEAAEKGDSIGASVECAVTGLPAGLGEPFFDSVESVLSHMLFSIPGVKGVVFGDGEKVAESCGSTFNDELYIDESGKVQTKTNHAGGINGGITNGMPLIFKVFMRPTPSIFQPQNTVDLKNGTNSLLRIQGRHDPCIALRAVPVIESVCAFVLCDLFMRDNALAIN